MVVSICCLYGTYCKLQRSQTTLIHVQNILELSIFAIRITVERQDMVVYIREIMISTLGNLNLFVVSVSPCSNVNAEASFNKV